MSARLRGALATALSGQPRRPGARAGDAVARADEARRARTSATAWGVAAAVHVLLLAVLGVVTFSQVLDRREEAFVVSLSLRPRTGGTGAKVPPAAVVGGETEAAADPSDVDPGAENLRVGADGAFTFEDVLAGRVKAPDPARGPSVPNAAREFPGARPRMEGRSGGRFAEARRRAGALPASDVCLGLALDWLARHQRPDGAWGPPHAGSRCRTPAECLGYSPDPDDSLTPAAPPTTPRVGSTSLALLALLGAGGGSPGAEHGEAVHSAVAHLIGRQGPDGCVGPKLGGYLYEHAFATLALVEASSIAGRTSYAEAARRAVAFLEAAQQDTGGFDYTERPSGRGDACLGAVAVMALRAAAQAGLSQQDRALRLAREFFDRLRLPDGDAAYAEGGAGGVAPAGDATRGSTASTFLARLYLGAPLDEPWMAKARGRLVGWRSRWSDLAAEGGDRSNTLYFWFLATQGLILAGPETWRLWNFHVQQELVDAQRTRGCASGSWAPPDAWISRRQGPVFTTALAALILETYNRQAVDALFAVPLRSARERLSGKPSDQEIREVAVRAVEEGDRSLAEAELPANLPPILLLELCASSRRLAPGAPAGDSPQRSARLRGAWEAGLADPDQDVRLRAAAATPAVIRLPWYPTLARAVQKEQDPAVRAKLVAALAGTPSRSLLGPAVAALRDPDPRVARAALRVVRAEGLLSSDLPGCLALARSPDLELRSEAQAAVLTCCSFEEPGVAEDVRRWLQDPDPAVRAQIAAGLLARGALERFQDEPAAAADAHR
ncbi:MAG: hypothetical protein HYZ53_07845 [Planctomycetes bacterium]|nr:hypothetical protein [Planctomycetota bacterium]